MTTNHPFHMTLSSPWPILLSFNLMNFFLSLILFFQFKMHWTSLLSLIPTLLIMLQWWRDVIRESTFQGCHTLMVTKLLKMGMFLFIISEFFFFISFFWTFFHLSISPSIEIGMLWPPKNISPFNPFDIPLLNSIVLIFSGFSVTWTHHALLENNFFSTLLGLIITIYLGIYFSCLQFMEYKQASFCFNDSSYGSIFFMTTGFHGMHIIIGIMLLHSCHTRLVNDHFSIIHHINFEIAVWYWHFVDFIWLFLYLSIYWWMN